MLRLQRSLRWLMPLAGGIVFALLLGLFFYIDLKTPRRGLAGLITLGLDSTPGIRFGLTLVLRELIPLHILLGLLAWLAMFLPGTLLLSPTWRRDWRALQGFWGAVSGLAWIHVCYWWKVPTALWVIPGARSAPLALVLPLLALIALLPGAWVVARSPGHWVRKGALLGLTVLLWSGLAEWPLRLAHQDYRPPAKPTHSAKILMLAIDGLREDVANQTGLTDFQGDHFPNAYSPLPATRLLYHILWGGDPNYYSVAHVVPSWEEYAGRMGAGAQDKVQSVMAQFQQGKDLGLMPLRLLEEAKRRGWKVRFCIDDGGTIGLSGRSGDFDAIYMPASGWENFVNSNLAVHFPAYAAWIDVLRVFPSTNPWSDPSSALVRTLEVGRGADWVMLHSCQSHQPIFLNREELKQIPGWWREPARNFEPKGSWKSLTQQEVDHWQSSWSPALAYRIRTSNLLRIYKGIWNQLDQDPDYQGATRIFFSDHGERFYHVTEQIQLQGVHGYGLDPWEMRVPLIIKVQGSPPEVRLGDTAAVSLLDLRNALWGLLESRPIEPKKLASTPFAPGRYHIISAEDLRPSEKKIRQQSKEKIIAATYILPSGIWITQYDRSLSERSKDVTLAKAMGDRLTVFKPLEAGGAQKTEYQGYRLVSEEDVDEPTFQSAKREIETVFFRLPWLKTGKNQ